MCNCYLCKRKDFKSNKEQIAYLQGIINFKKSIINDLKQINFHHKLGFNGLHNEKDILQYNFIEELNQCEELFIRELNEENE